MDRTEKGPVLLLSAKAQYRPEQHNDRHHKHPVRRKEQQRDERAEANCGD